MSEEVVQRAVGAFMQRDLDGILVVPEGVTASLADLPEAEMRRAA